MKNTNIIARAMGLFSLAALASVLVTGCVVAPDGRVGVAAGVVVAPPPAEVVVVPDDYYWDGYEYIGIVGGGYFYLGPGNVWVRCEPWRVERFEGWERGHPDWREHGVHNDRFRGNGHGHDRDREHDRDR